MNDKFMQSLKDLVTVMDKTIKLARHVDLMGLDTTSPIKAKCHVMTTVLLNFTLYNRNMWKYELFAHKKMYRKYKIKHIPHGI